MRNLKRKKLSPQLNQPLQNELFDASDTLMYIFELVSHDKLPAVPNIHYWASIFVLNYFNLLSSIAVMSLNKSFYILLHTT